MSDTGSAFSVMCIDFLTQHVEETALCPFGAFGEDQLNVYMWAYLGALKFCSDGLHLSVFYSSLFFFSFLFF